MSLILSVNYYQLLLINASNNETLINAIENGLRDQFSSTENTCPHHFQGQTSYIQYIAYILNLIVKKLLKILKSGDCASAELTIEQVLKC
jgi:hypothetical protein